jgi:DNA end-binding protein Ku
MPRSIWKGAISFGLVHVPVALYPASHETDIDFDWLDKRTMDPVGYKRINKRTGREINKDHIVKGVKQRDGSYVVLSDDEVRAAYPKSTQTIQIEAFVPAQDISLVYLERPYYLEPVGRAAKVYALLREAMADASLIGIARLVMHTKEHLAALLPAGPALMLATLRWANEIRSAEELQLPPAGKSDAGLSNGELRMAGQLIKQMTVDFDPRKFENRFAASIHALIARKVEAGDTATVEPLEDAVTPDASNVVDLTELLRNSLKGRKGAGSGAKAAAKRPARTAPGRAKNAQRKRA